MTALPKLVPSRMTVEEFLDWSGDGSGKKFELVDGEPRAMALAQRDARENPSDPRTFIGKSSTRDRLWRRH
jgi:Uma2 family endonuclease